MDIFKAHGTAFARLFLIDEKGKKADPPSAVDGLEWENLLAASAGYFFGPALVGSASGFVSSRIGLPGFSSLKS